MKYEYSPQNYRLAPLWLHIVAGIGLVAAVYAGILILRAFAWWGGDL